MDAIITVPPVVIFTGEDMAIVTTSIAGMSTDRTIVTGNTVTGTGTIAADRNSNDVYHKVRILYTSTY